MPASPIYQKRNNAVHNKDEAEQRYAEFAGDIMALQAGSNQKDLAYVQHLSDPYGNFKEAREYMRQKFFK